MKRILLEIIAASVDDALAAEKGGAERLELCSALALGGLTPSLGTLQAIKAEVGIPAMCMVRPREGGMAYDSGEFKAMLRDAENLVKAGGDGVVFGFLTDTGKLDVERCREFLARVDDAAGGRAIDKVFHRAFDVVADPAGALEQLIELGVTRVLTSGRAPTAIEGIGQIRNFVGQAAGRIQILPGGGIDLESVGPIVDQTGVDQVHLYVTRLCEDRSVTQNRSIYFGAHLPTSELDYHRVDAEKVRAVRNALDV